MGHILFTLAIPLLWLAAVQAEEQLPIYRNTGAEVPYAGSKSCQGARCHDTICRAYPRTPMGRSMAPANAPEELARAPKPVTIHCKDLNRYFQVYREGNDLFQSEYELDAQGKTVYKDTRRLEDVVGGGINGYT